jgi:hypothetical protein
MKNFGYLSLCLAMFITGCSDKGNNETNYASPADSSTAAAPQAKPPSKRGGTITVGDETWTFVPSTQCSVYPGNLVSIAGHAKEDESVEIVIDASDEWAGGVRVGKDGTDTSWHAVPDSIAVTIENKRVMGTASFATSSYSVEAVAEGSFDIECGY